MENRIKELITEMTLEEKARLCIGKNFWYMNGVERLGIPEVMVTDGPHGLRKQSGSSDHLGIHASVPATCFPPAVTAASGWDSQNLVDMGAAIGEEAVQEDVAVVLGPGTNIKRSPLCGRNFEYFSEDPYLSGIMSTAWVQGVQSKGIGTSLKHFAANNQEKARLSGNSIVDERALREIYLSAFEHTVKEAKPWTLMCSYNRVNNTFACENEWLLTDVLRKEWGFDGLVMTDWGAMDDRVRSLKAGLELEMPGPGEWNVKKIVKAVKEGELEQEVLDIAVEKLLTLILNAEKVEKRTYDIEKHHALARKAASESMVLLKNDGMLPLDTEKEYVVLGTFAKNPRYQGAGSSKIVPHRVDSPLEEMRKMNLKFSYADGYLTDCDQIDETLMQEAVELAKEKDGVIIFAGLPPYYESEGFDRTSLNLPESHNVLIEEVAAVNPHVTVVLMCGSVVLMPWRENVESILLSYLGGEAVGGACADILSGTVNPSGKLGETFPLALEDTACYEHFAAEEPDVEYRESILVGYRYYDWAKKEVAYPFGFGLSYTSFFYDSLSVEWNDEEKYGSVKVQITNTGKKDGAEVVQCYIGKKESAILRAPKELKGFAKVFLKAGESCITEIALEERSFSYYDTGRNEWSVEDGDYQIYVGASSRDLRLKQEIFVKGKEVSDEMIERDVQYKNQSILKDGKFAATREQFERIYGRELPLTVENGKWTLNTRLGVVLKDEKGKELFGDMVDNYCSAFQNGDDVSRMMLAMVMDAPLRSLAMFGGVNLNVIEKKIKERNEQ